MNLYAESSAVLAWLLGEAAGSRIREAHRRAELVFASDLLLIECDRVLIRAVTLGEIDEATAANRRAHLNAAAAHWHIYRLSLDIVERARRAFLGNLCVPYTRFTWHRHWRFVPPSPVWNSSVSTIASVAPASNSDSAFNRGDE